MHLEQHGRHRIYWRLHIYRWMIGTNVTFLGHLQEAEALLEKAKPFMEARKSPEYSENRSSWEGEVEEAEARLLAARGRYRQAEAAFHSAQIWNKPGDGSGIEAVSRAETTDICYRLPREGHEGAARRLAKAKRRVRALLGMLGSMGGITISTCRRSSSIWPTFLMNRTLSEAERLARAASAFADPSLSK